MSVLYRFNETYDFAIIHSTMGRDKTTKKIIFLPFLDNGIVLWMADLLIFLSTSDYAACWHVICISGSMIWILDVWWILYRANFYLFSVLKGESEHTNACTHHHYYTMSHTRMETWSATDCCGSLKNFMKRNFMTTQKQHKE